MDTETFVECWQLLLNYISRREQHAATEQLMGYLMETLPTSFIEQICDQDSDLAKAYATLKEDEDDDEMSKQEAIEKIADFFKKEVFPKVKREEPELLTKIKNYMDT